MATITFATGTIVPKAWLQDTNDLVYSATTAKMANQLPSAVAITGGTITTSGVLNSNSPTGGVGYSTGAGSTITQQTNKSTGVIINATCGTITMNGAALVAGTEVKFTVSNTSVATTDIPVVAIKSGGTSGSYLLCVSAVASNSFDITISNASGGDLSEAVVISFAIIKGVAA